MQKNISNKVFLGQNISLFDNAGGSEVIYIEQPPTIMMLKKKFKKLENLLKQEIMMLILLNPFLVFSR